MRWIRGFVSRRQRHDDLTVSIKEHLEDKIEELTAAGVPREEAERTARREFGNVTLIEERSREVWQWPRIESIWADMKFALRQLRKAPAFTATAVLTLSLGIAVNATMFSLVSAFLLPRLPGKNPQKVVVISSVNPEGGDFADTSPVSAPNFLAWRNDHRIFAQMAAADDGRSGSLTWQRQPEAIQYAAVSPNYFSVFGCAPFVGRSFVQGEDEPGRDHVVILSHGLWVRRFASDPSVIGKIVHLNREDYTVVGVMGANFRLLDLTPPQLWTPLVVNASDQAPAARKNRFLHLFGRLVPGVTLEQARAELRILAKQAEADYPAIEKRWSVAARSLPDYVVYAFGLRTGLAVLMTTVSFVLLIACANVAGLLLTRASGRQKELAIRVSLGAGRARIVRQLLTEGLVIAVFGGCVGLLLTYFGINLVRSNLTFDEALIAVPLGLDRNVLLFAIVICVLAAVLSSLAPAIKVSHTDVNAELTSESRAASSGRSQSRLRAVLVTGEIALALVLLVGSCLLIRGVFLLDHQKLGFRTDHVLTAGITLDHARYGDASQQLSFIRRLTPQLQQIPGVKNVAVASNLPAIWADRISIRIKGEPKLPSNEHRSALYAVVTTDYFHVADIPLLRGRTFTETDDVRAPRVVVVNQEFVHRYFHDQDPLGKQIQVDLQDTMPGWSSIVGVVSNVSYFDENRVDPEVYESFFQRPVASYSLMLRSRIEPRSLASALRHAVARLDRDLPLASVMSMDTAIDRERKGDDLFTRVLGSFAVLALILAAIGVYGLVAYSVSQRTQEIGIRMAVGAQGSDVRRMILRGSFKMTAIGSTLGLALALPLPRFFDAIFPSLHTGAPVLYLIVLAAMLIVAAFATYIPARRAAHVDPIAALRNQ